MKSFPMRGYVWTMLACAVVLSACVLSSDLRVVVHAFVNVFASGRTGYKTLLFLAYIIVMLALVVFYGHRKDTRAKTAGRWGIGAIIMATSAYVANLILYFWFMISNGFPLKVFSLIFNNGQMISMQLLHNHISKGPLALVTSIFHLVPPHTTDDGRTMLGLIPDAWFIVLGILILSAAICLIGAFVVRIPRLRAMKPFNRAGYIALFIISSFMIMKSMIDGGGLSFEAVIGMSFFLLWIGEGSRWSRVSAVALLASYTVLYAILYFVGYFSAPSGYGYASFSLMTTELLLVSFLAFYSEGKTRLTVLVGLLTLVAVCGQAYNSMHTLPYLHAVIPAADGAYVASYNPLVGDGYSLIGTAGAFGIYRFLPATDTPITDVIALTGVKTNPDPVIIPWKSCLPSGPDNQYLFTLWSAAPLSQLSDRTEVYAFSALPVKDADHTYTVTITVPQCLAIMPTLLVDEILAQYSSRYAYYDISSRTNDIASFAGDN